MTRKAVKGSVIVDHLADHAREDYGPLKFDFLDEDVPSVEEWKLDWWNMYFDGAVNIYGNRASTMIISLNKILLFTCMNRVNLQSATWTFLGNYTYQFP